jgi:hypothetical protein
MGDDSSSRKLGSAITSRLPTIQERRGAIGCPLAVFESVQ